MKVTPDDLYRSGIPRTWHCVDCGINTAPGHPSLEAMASDLTHKGYCRVTMTCECEVYCTTDEIWSEAGMGRSDGCLCIGCLEKRLGRRLMRSDFDLTDGLNNIPGTRRMKRRQGEKPVKRPLRMVFTADHMMRTAMYRFQVLAA